MRGHLQMLQRTLLQWVPKPFQRPFQALLKLIINTRAETYATFTSHTIQCVHKLPAEENIYLILMVVIKSMMWEFLEALYLPPGVPFCKSVSTQAVNTTINQRMSKVMEIKNYWWSCTTLIPSALFTKIEPTVKSCTKISLWRTRILVHVIKWGCNGAQHPISTCRTGIQNWKMSGSNFSTVVEMIIIKNK